MIPLKVIQRIKSIKEYVSSLKWNLFSLYRIYVYIIIWLYMIYILYIYKWNLVMLEQLHLKLEKVKAILLLQMKI